MGIKFTLHETHHFNHFKVYSSATFSFFTMLWNHHHSLLPEHFVTPKEKAYDHQAVYHYSPIIPAAPGNYYSAFCLYVFC